MPLTPMPDPLLLDIPREFTTPRLHLRTMRAGDGPLLHDAIAESVPALRQYLGHLPWVAEEPTQTSAELRARRCEAFFASRVDLVWLALDKATGRVVGSMGLHRTDWNVPRTEVGYWLRSSAAGQGYASEGVNALVGWAFAGLKAQRVELMTDEANAASRRVAERCGFALEAVLRQHQRAPDGSLRNTCVYARWPG
jgi:RimJ/RimL family protein N-acetyltransferase